MKYAYFLAGKLVLAVVAPVAIVATITSALTMGALYLSHGLHLRAERWGR